MTTIADIKALAPNAAAKAALATKGHDYATLQALTIQHAAELKILVTQLVALHPAAGDATTLTNLNTILAALA